MTVAEKIRSGRTFIGIEFGSTRIKAVMTDDTHSPVAQGSHEWENRFENGLWTYSLDDIKTGMQSCFAALSADVSDKYDVALETCGAMGISAMMHGIMPFDKDGRLLCPFRTWRNTNTGAAAAELSQCLSLNIPMRWSISHLYQLVLDNEPFTKDISYITTLAVYIHYLLTGRLEAGIGEASGMFPVKGNSYDTAAVERTEQLLAAKGFSQKLSDILPQVRTAGESGAVLTEAGALLLDPTGTFKAGVPLCPPEGDAGTGMTATNSVRAGTGNISAGTSIFSMLVMDRLPENAYPEIDIVTTPDGAPVAMVHCNNCCSEIDAWVRMFGEFAEAAGIEKDRSALYEMLYGMAMKASPDCEGVTAYNFLSGEPVAGVENGRPMYFRTPDSKLTLGSFMRAQLYSTAAALKNGMDILFEREKMTAERFTGHGGLFKVKNAAAQIIADALNTPVSVMTTAGEGGAWGMALLAEYMINGGECSLPDWLDRETFCDMQSVTNMPDKAGSEGFASFMNRFNKGLDAEKLLGKENFDA